MSGFDLSNGTTAINTILAEEANRIGSDIYSRTLHTSPWLDLTKQSAFADGMGYQQTTLVYDRAIATTDVGGGTAAGSGAWTNVGTLNAGANNFGASDSNQPLKDAADSVQGPSGGVDGTTTDNRSFVQFNKQLKKYNLERAVIESPRISIEDLRFAAHRQEQLRAIMDIMTQVTRNTWEDRYRNEFEKASDNVVQCKAAGSTFTSGKEGDSIPVALGDVDTVSPDGADDVNVADANISNAVLDKAYFQLIRAGAGANAYGRENGRPVFALVCSSEASYQLQTEAGFRDDVRYNNAKVSDLIAPLGIEKSFRGFYHLVDDLAPRFGTAATEVDATDRLVPIPPYSVSGGKATPNANYESAEYEVAFILHPEVCEAQIPNPLSGGNGLSFDPVNYRGKFDWKNIANEITNPDGTIGFFRGVLASATKPIKTEFGYAIIFKRTSSTPAT